MTTKDSPESKLRRQAEMIAIHMKACERGEIDDPKLKAKRKNDASLVTGVAMDDKFLTIEITWDVIRDTKPTALAEYILKLMKEETTQ